MKPNILAIDWALVDEVALSLVSHVEFYDSSEALRCLISRLIQGGGYMKGMGESLYIPYVRQAIRSKYFRQYYGDITLNRYEVEAVAEQLFFHYLEEISDMADIDNAVIQ